MGPADLEQAVFCLPGLAGAIRPLITIEKLSTVEQGEAFLRRHDFQVFRVRHHENVARIEVLPEDMFRLCSEPLRSELVAHFKAIGYTYVTMDLAGFRSGSMNESLRQGQGG